MRVTVITCDNCLTRLEENEQVTSMGAEEWCERCASFEARPLHRIQPTMWPKLIMRSDVRAYLEWRDQQDVSAEKELVEVRRELAKATAELARVREQAADGYANAPQPATVLSDIATAARRGSGVKSRVTL